jgi:hypothetical protein
MLVFPSPYPFLFNELRPAFDSESDLPIESSMIEKGRAGIYSSLSHVES